MAVQPKLIRIKDIERPLVIALCILYVAMTQMAYFLMDIKLFGYSGIASKDLDPFWYFLSFAMAAVPGFWMPIRLQRSSMVAYWILYLTVIVPVMWLPYQVLKKPPESYLMYAGVALTCFAVLGLAFRFPRWHIPRFEMPRDIFFLFLAALLSGMTVMVWSINGFKFDLGLSNIYARRKQASDLVDTGSLIAYIKLNLSAAVQPYAFAIGFSRRSWPLVAMAFLAAIVGFSVDGSKAAAAVPLFLLLLYPVVTRCSQRFGIIMPFLASLAVLLVFTLWSITKLPWFPVLTTWRLIEVKGLLSGYYWDYFSTHDHTLLADGLLRNFFVYEHQFSVPRLIGVTYFGSLNMDANANLWASSFGDFGYFGMIAATGVLFMIFRLLDSLAANRGLLVPAFLSAFLGMKMSDAAMDTALVSHGVLLMLILLYILPAEKPKPQSSPNHPEPVGAPV